MNEPFFRIGELSKLFGIGVDSIRYYEKVGLLHPTRNTENNYRFYSMDDIRQLTMIRELLNLNFSTEQIRHYDLNRTLEHTTTLLEDELTVINEEIAKLYETKNSIQARLKNIYQNTSSDHLNHIRVLELEDRPCVMVSNDNLPDNYVDYYLVQYMHSMQKNIDTIGACDCYTLDLKNSNPDSLYYRTKNVFFYSDTLTYHSNYTLPAGTYLSLMYRGALSKTKEWVPKLFEYAKKHNYSIHGDPIEFCYIDDYETEIQEEYVTELQLKVKP
ncbi:MAG: MerR family transcriptional regulator [Anaerostipes sp.]|nr:MerR family transcriptional regulator [Anaerostipes sp.]